MRKVLLLIFVYFFIDILYGQEEKIYEPFVFESYSPVWQHTVIDTSLIDDFFRIDFHSGDSVFYDGFSQFYGVDILQVVPVFYNDKVFLIEQFGSTLASEGAFIQCMDSNSGELNWETGYDLRNIEKSEYPSYAYINDNNQLEILGYRQDVSKGPYPTGFWNHAKLTVRKYNIETGYLEEQLLINEDDSLSADLWPSSLISIGTKSAIYPYGDNKYQYLNLSDSLKSIVLDSNSHIVDKIINKRLLHQYNSKIQFKMFRNLKNENLVFMYDAPFGTFNFADSSEMYIMKIDNVNNVLVEKDIKQELKPTDNPEETYYIHYNDDYITFIGDKHVDIGDTTIAMPVYTVFDSDANKIEELELTDENGEPYHNGDYNARQGIVLKLKYEPGILIFANELGSDGFNYLNIFKTDGSGNYARIKHLKVMGKNHKLGTTGAYFTPEGDVVLKALDFNSVFKNYTNSNTWATVYTLFQAEDLDIKTSIEEPISFHEMQLYPNPAKDELYVELENKVDGKIELYDILSKKITTDFIIGERSKKVDINFMIPGLYFVKIIVDDQVYSVGKVVKN